ncbi:hypothetical protein GGF46_003357 [Coemansia sp. RSA 552]|nr:hypothetical protein GGF46_003357 [Coemansia sp. RSA 552]
MLGILTRAGRTAGSTCLAERPRWAGFATTGWAQKLQKSKQEVGRREQIENMKRGRLRARVDALQGKGRSGGGKSQLLEARVRRARDKKDKFQQARDYVQRLSTTPKEQSLAEARILRQRSRQLKGSKTPGLGFTPARFRLLPIENETGSDLTALSSGTGAQRRTMTIKQVRAQVADSTFDNIGLGEDVARAATQIIEEQIRKRNPHSTDAVNVRPTEIQALGIPEILGHSQVRKQTTKEADGLRRVGPSVFLAGETGSGKTFAYALPLVTQLKREEAEAKGKVRRDRLPRALVVVPSRELVKQVTSVFKAVGHVAKIRAMGLHLGMRRRDVRAGAGDSPVDVVVATPGAVLRYMVKDTLFSPAAVSRLVVDEADSLMDSHSFGDQIQKVLGLISKTNQKYGRREQAVFVSATLPKLIREKIIRQYPDIVHVTTPSLHRAPSRLAQTFIDVSKEYQGHRLNALWFVLRTAAADKHLIIFCNNKAHANLVFRQLYKRGIPSLLLAGAEYKKTEKPARRSGAAADGQGERSAEERRNAGDAWERATWFAGQEEAYAAIDQAAGPDSGAATEAISGADTGDLDAPIPEFNREEVLRAFLGKDPVPQHLLPPVEPDAADVAPGDARRKILVCTDLGSRGLDTTCVSHVVLFDFPTTAIDYLHRAGRTARAGAKGKVTALVGKKDRRLAEQIRLAIRQGGTIS